MAATLPAVEPVERELRNKCGCGHEDCGECSSDGHLRTAAKPAAKPKPSPATGLSQAAALSVVTRSGKHHRCPRHAGRFLLGAAARPGERNTRRSAATQAAA